METDTTTNEARQGGIFLSCPPLPLRRVGGSYLVGLHVAFCIEFSFQYLFSFPRLLFFIIILGYLLISLLMTYDNSVGLVWLAGGWMGGPSLSKRRGWGDGRIGGWKGYGIPDWI
jgi:hypothetical protein